MSSTVEVSRRTRAAATAVAEVEATADAKRDAAALKNRRRREARLRVEIMEARIASGEIVPSSEDMAELDADRDEAGLTVGRAIPGARVPERDIVSMAAGAARRALDVERRAGWRIDANRRRDLMPELQAVIVAAVWALGADGAAPMWREAPEPTGAADRAAYASPDLRQRWRAALLPVARTVVWEYRQEDEGKRAARNVLTAEEATARTADEMIGYATDTVRAMADLMADGGRPITTRERTGMVAALLADEKVTARDRARIDGRASASAQMKAESLGRSAMRARWPLSDALRADVVAAERAIRRGQETNLRLEWEATYGPNVATAMLTRAANVKRAADALRDAAALPATAPERRVSKRAMPVIVKAPERRAIPTTRLTGAGEIVTAAIERQHYRRARVSYATGADWTPRVTPRVREDDPAHRARAIALAKAETEANRARLAAARLVWAGR